MGKIRILPDIVASKIAAGEVVERPASVVKELIENAIDAGARRITVEVEASGKKVIRVADDGEGMTRDDALLAFERHSTSKLASADDLNHIATLGFRGEALPSIASVSKILLRTKTAADVAGTEIALEGGKIKSVRECAWSEGTEIDVRDLFFNVPARRKFLRSDMTELFHITNVVTHYALAYPHLAFTLRHEGRQLLDVSPVGNVRDRAYQVFGADFLSTLVEIDYNTDAVRVKGFTSRPTSVRTTREAQYFFVNGRYVKDRLISKSLGEAYRTMIPSGMHPAAILFVEVAPEDVDVNVHPAKTEVRFRRPTLVEAAIRAAVEKALTENKPILEVRPTMQRPLERRTGKPEPGIEMRHLTAEALHLQSPVEKSVKSPAQPSLQLGFAERAKTPPALSHSPTTPRGPETSESAPTVGASASADILSPIHPVGGRSPRFEVALPSSTPLPIQPLGQLRESFIVATSPEGLLLIDQHAAHERVLFERFRRRFRERTVETQPLLLPRVIELTPAQAATFEHIKDELEAIGCELGQLSGRSLVIKALPTDVPLEQAEALIREILDVIEAEKRTLTIEDIRDCIAARFACRAAVKVNEPLTDEMMVWLVQELLSCATPSNCPHGRPTILKLSIREIERLFHRS
ncbi:MAG TPA: DNA mismatch repair endonuclease MutL [Blastocatellia bacterium]|nr:DNA mismatch repair endonuclease MutL [Blastocatellia bacterium]